MANKTEEQSIAEKVKAYNDAKKSGKQATPPLTVEPDYTHKALTTYKDPSSQQWYMIIVGVDPVTGQAKVLERHHALAGQLEAREMFKINATKLGIV